MKEAANNDFETETRLAEQIATSYASGTPADYMPDAQKLIATDEAEAGKPMGQRVRDTFPLADVFFNSHRPAALRKEVERFVEILFGHPFHTPTRDEFAMFHAKAAALRSADLSRQVGAVIATLRGDIIAIGTNEVPSPTGGAYWEGDERDSRDFQLGKSTSHEMRRTALGEIVLRLRKANILTRTGNMDSIIDQVSELMRDTLLMNSGEFGRTVHAEMAALLDAARRGVSIDGATIYSTTFPCHNCARHLIASGIKRVVYVEPFPKSLAQRLHPDAIVVDSDVPIGGKLNFEPFVGIAPKRYTDFFQAPRRKTSDDRPVRWKWNGALPRFPKNWPAPTILIEEQTALLRLREATMKAGLVPGTSQGSHDGGNSKPTGVKTKRQRKGFR